MIYHSHLKHPNHHLHHGIIINISFINFNIIVILHNHKQRLAPWLLIFAGKSLKNCIWWRDCLV